ncbi:hypothetical protein BDV12DRAFT_200020 [Aspergillus spectabilis]
MPVNIPNALEQVPTQRVLQYLGTVRTTGDFCTPSSLSTGVPGTAAPGENGCISNCGTDIILVTDYLVFRTCDLHGQWEYVNRYATPGFPSYDERLGNRLRSHVNLTETVDTLSMVTKVGVPSNMTIVGVSSYGPSLEVTTPGCWTEQCKYMGPESGAFAGRCTTTAGYISDYEIGEILRTNPTAQDCGMRIRIRMSSSSMTRSGWHWAIDLQSEGGGGRGSDDDDEETEGTYYADPDIWNATTPL